MEKENEINKTTWFLNPWFDVILLASFPFVFMFPFTKSLYSRFPHAPYYFYTALNLPHVISGLCVIYLFNKEYKKRPVLYLGGPLIIFVSTLASFSLKFILQLEIIRVFWSVWHNFVQDYQTVKISKLINRDNQKIDRIIDTLLIVAVFTYMAFLYLLFFQRKLVKNGNLTLLTAHSLKFITAVAWLTIIVFILRQSYLFLGKRKGYALKVFLISKVFLSNFLFRLGDIRNILIDRQTVIHLHSKQYVAWVWLYFHRQHKDKVGNEKKLLHRLAQVGSAPFYIFLILLISIIITLVTIRMHRFEVMNYMVAFIHFFLDGRTWRIYRESFNR